MAKPCKRIIPRSNNGRFRKTTPTDFGIGGVCECGHFLLQHYDGDERERPFDPRKWGYRCFTCKPRTEAELELQAKIEASKPRRGLASMIIEAAIENRC